MTPISYETPYLPFELLIGAPSIGGYPVTVIDSPAGDGEALCTLSIDAELQDALAVVETGLSDQAFLTELGTFFFTALFTGNVAKLYHTSLGMARSQSKRLRIRLRITPPELAALPWEYLYDGQEDAFLAISSETALVRYVPITLPVRPTTVKLPLRILVVIASPRDMQPLDVAYEKTSVQAALSEWEKQGRIQLEILEQARVADISQALRHFQPHVFHFIGHGLFEQEIASIILEDEVGNARLVDERTFRELFNGCQETRLAVLNACQTATVSSTQPLVGLAPRLLQRQLSAVVAMQHAIPDQTALVFTREFYRSLALGAPVDVAISEARKGIFIESGGQSSSWGTPVLFLRAKDGLLFNIETSEPKPIAIPEPPEPTRPPEIFSFVGRDIELTYFAEKLDATHLAVIAGMAGVGKTALATKLTEWTARDRDHIFWHSFHEGEGIDVILWGLAGFLAWHGRRDLWQLLQSARLTGGKPPPSETLFDYLLQLVRGGNFLFCFDDFHHVDDDPVLNQLVERLRGALNAGELSIIITSRRVPDFVTLAEFRPLEGLSAADARQLLLIRGLQLTEAQIDELYKHTIGNAEFLTLAINALQQAKNPDILISRLAESDDIERYLLQEVDETLTGQERGLMSAVSVLLGYAGTRNAIETVLSSGNVFRTLRRLAERHLLTVRDGEAGREYLQHAIVQTFYYEQTSLRERRAMHRRAGVYYETEETDFLRASTHFARAGDYEHAATIATKDVWSIINRGQARALRNLLEGFRYEQLEKTQWVKVKIAQGLDYAFLSERELSSQSYQDALTSLVGLPNESAISELRARVCQGMGELFALENPQLALTWLQRGLTELPTGNLVEAAAIYIHIGTVHMHLGEYVAAIEMLQLGLERLSAEPSQLRSIALMNLGAVHFHQGDLTPTIAYTESALQISRILHDHFQSVNLLTVLGLSRYIMGDWKHAIALFHDALAIVKSLGSTQLQASVELNLGAAYINLGDDADAFKHLQSSLELAHFSQLHMIEVIAQFRLADLQTRLGQWSIAESLLQEAEQLALELADHGSLGAIYSTWAEVKLALQDISAAHDYATRAVDIAKELGEKLDEGIGLRILGQTLLITDQRQAITILEQSVLLLEVQDPYEAARTKMQLGIAWLRNMNTIQGTALLNEVQTIFQSLGAKRDLLQLTKVRQTEDASSLST